MTPSQQPALIRMLLSDPACYDHPVKKLELIETHISWVILTGLYAYKIKKPVNLGFLNFSTLARRQADCLEELRLNRRLAAAYYMAVVAITGTIVSPRITLAQADDAIEYAVKMRQFPADVTLDCLATQGRLGELQIDALAARIAHFHVAECAHAPADSLWGEPCTIAQAVVDNFEQLNPLLAHSTERRMLLSLQHESETEQLRLAPLMRVRKYWVRECHGDLHLANIAWVDGQLLIFDCLEFNPELRWIDVISEVAFCYMDLLHRNYVGLASRFLNAWLECSGDYAGVALLRYYAAYRALVRAKVAALRMRQLADKAAAQAEVTRCLQLAQQLSKALSLKLWITHGLSGSGKTHLTQILLQEQDMIRLRSDVERKRLAGLDTPPESFRGGLYTPQASHYTYEHLVQRAESLLEAGWPVIVDAACLERWQRDLFRDLAKKFKAEFKILDLQAAPAILRERVSRRAVQGQDASEADLNVLQHQLENATPLANDELAEVTRVGSVSTTLCDRPAS